MLGVADPIVVAVQVTVQQAGPRLLCVIPFVNFAVVCGLPGIMLVSIYASSRIVLLDPDDGMLPAALADVKPFSARRIG